MAEQQDEAQAADEKDIPDSVLAADKRSKMAGLVVALGVFVLAQFTTARPQFSAIIAAVAGIGIRIYIPYRASRSVTDPDAMSIASHPDTGDYHYGAVGLALLCVPFVALVAMIAVKDFNRSILAGAVVGPVAYVVFRSHLPRA